jgi:hypothetical protein
VSLGVGARLGVRGRLGVRVRVRVGVRVTVRGSTSSGRNASARRASEISEIAPAETESRLTNTGEIWGRYWGDLGEMSEITPAEIASRLTTASCG